MTRTIGPVNAAVPTPLTERGDLDRRAVRSLCQRCLDVALDGVFVIGSMGEGSSLPESVRDAFVALVLEELGERMTVFASAADSSRARMLERAKRYAAMGAHYVVLCLPGSVAAAGVRDVLAVAEACPSPCGYYESPANTHSPLVLDEMLTIGAHENIYVIKDSSNSALIAQGITASGYRLPHVKVLDGVEYRTAQSAMLGYDGVLHGGGALTGRWIRSIWDAVMRGDLDQAVAMDRAKALFLASVYNRFSRPLQNVIGQKYALKLLGVFNSECVAMNQYLNDDDRRRISEAVAAHREWIEARPSGTANTAS